MKLFVANFDKDVTEDELDGLFTPYGPINDLRIWIDFETGQSRGFGFVELKYDWCAERAIEELNGIRWRGNYLKVSEARRRC